MGAAAAAGAGEMYLTLRAGGASVPVGVVHGGCKHRPARAAASAPGGSKRSPAHAYASEHVLHGEHIHGAGQRQHVRQAQRT